jgi:hypothetical protein
LETAVAIAFPDNGMTVSGLRNEIRKGNLEASRVAGCIWTTLGHIERMMQRCQIPTEADGEPKARNSTYANQGEQAAHGAGSSLTAPAQGDASSAAQAHLNKIVQRLRKPSRPISPKSTSQTSATVVPIKS